MSRHPGDVSFVLFGHSSGCRLAWEAAMQLTERGRAVQLVAIGDGPTATHRSLMSVLAEVRTARQALGIPVRAAQVMRRQRAYRRTARFGESEIRIDIVKQQYALSTSTDTTVRLLALRRAMASEWRPRHVPVPVTVFASDHWSQRERRRALGWRNLGSEVRVVSVAGDHDLLSAERVSAFADALGKEIPEPVTIPTR